MLCSANLIKKVLAEFLCNTYDSTSTWLGVYKKMRGDPNRNRRAMQWMKPTLLGDNHFLRKNLSFGVEVVEIYTCS